MTLVIATLLVGGSSQASSIGVDQTTYEQVYPSIPAELTDRARTANFIRSTRSILKYNMSSMEQIYFRVATLKLLDPTLSNLPTALRDQFIGSIALKQNTNGGFGPWQYSRSDLPSTFQAVQVYEWLGATYNRTLVKTYLDRLRNLVSNGFNTHLKDGDSDIYSTSLAIITYSLMGMTPANSTTLVSKIQNAQNLNATRVSSAEIGGFGMQTNSLKGVYWTSEIPVSSIAISALSNLLSGPLNTTLAASFFQNMQLSTGGFVKSPAVISSSITYTAVALKALNLLGSAPVDAVKAESYIRSLEHTDGGFLQKATSTGTSLRGTYYGVLALKELGLNPANVTATQEFVLNTPFLTDGFGGSPGTAPSLRETFDAVAAFSYMKRSFAVIGGITSYVGSYYNLDGGYGLTGSFMDSTSRAISIYKILNVTVPNAATTINFVQGLQQSNGGFSKKASNTTTFTVSTYRAILTLHQLGATPTNVAGAISYLQSLQNLDGGFGGFAGDTSDVSSTYRAIRALHLLGAEPLDKNKAISYLQGAQNPDGGFKRSPSDVVRPKNISQAVYTYSSVRGLDILGASPTNVTGVYDYVFSLRNRDGGYGEHPDFTSDVAYTFTSLWILANFDRISGFSLGIPQDWNQVRSQYASTSVMVSGGYPSYIYNISDSTGAIDMSGVLAQPGQITIDTSALPLGTYSVNIVLTDFTGAQVNVTRQLLISDVTDTAPTTSTPTTSSQTTTDPVTTDPVTTDPVTTSSTVATTPASSTAAKSSGLLVLVALAAILPVSILRKRK